MPVFTRSFDINSLAKWDEGCPDNAVRLLFKRWALPGEMVTGVAPLRLAIRRGYINFYAKGQSVAKLEVVRGCPRLSVHNAYVVGRLKDDGPPLEGYKHFDSDALADPATAALVDGWTKTALSYASAEKRFVDDLVAANPGIIDLEMGLPASDLPDSGRVAPRMDLVIAQLAEDAPPSIAFWEAKCANNKELRVTGNGKPHVLDQVEKYVRWMAESGRIAEVQSAYRETAAILLELYRLFRSVDGATPESVRIWQVLAATVTPTIIVQPGIVIGNYWPEGYTEKIASGRMAQFAASFATNGHRKKIAAAGVRVHEVGPDHESAKLPIL